MYTSNGPTPAFLELLEDDAIIEHQTAFRVYVMLLRNGVISHIPQPVKVWALAEVLKCRHSTIIKSLNLLVDHGYVIETGRDDKGVRQLLVPMFRATNRSASKGTNVPERTLIPR